MRLAPARVLAALAALALLGTACTTTGTEDPATTSPATGGSTPTSAAADQFPVTIETAFGDVTIESEPQRVVTVGWSDAEVALALGVQPVGDADWLAFGGDGQGPWNQGKYTTPPVMVGTLELNMEAIAELAPDLILDTRSSGEQSRYDQLSGLGVPVVGVPEGGEAYLTTWDQQLDMVGKALGKSAEAAQLKSDLDERFTEVAAANPAFEGTTMAAGVRTGSGWGAYVSGDARVDFLTRLGFTPAPAIEERRGDNFFIQLSNEQLNLLDADLTVIFLIQATSEEVRGDRVLQAVPSVSAGNVVYLEDQAISNAFSSGSVLGLGYALDEVPPLLADVLG